MNERRVTYAEVKLAKNSERPQMKPKEGKSFTTAKEQAVTYAESSLHSAAQDPQENGKSCHLQASPVSLPAGLAAPPEKFIAEILGIKCLVLLSIIVLIYVISPLFPIVPTEDDFSTVTNTQKEGHCGPCPTGWFSYSNNCYYFSPEKKTWRESMTACQSNKSQLLYIDTEEEMTFMKSISVLSWIGVHCNGSDQPWTFVNGSHFQLEIGETSSTNNHCVMLQSKYYADNCEDPYMYYCKHKV